MSKTRINPRNTSRDKVNYRKKERQELNRRLRRQNNMELSQGKKLLDF